MTRAAGQGTYERRSFAFKLQRADGTTPSRLVGHAAVFEELSEEMGFWMPFRERISRGAFDGALERVRSGQDHVYALLNHDENYIIASTPGGTLNLTVDETGLLASMQPKDTQTIRDMVVQPILDGDLRKMSFGFTVGDEHDEIRDKQTIRVIDQIDRLYDVSPVTFPAYPQTDIGTRKLIRALGVDERKLSFSQRAALRSFIEAMPQLRALDDEDDPAAEQMCSCGHAESVHADGTGACSDPSDSCASYTPVEDNSLDSTPGTKPSSVTVQDNGLKIPARRRQGASAPVAHPAIAGANADTLLRELDLHLRDFDLATH